MENRDTRYFIDIDLKSRKIIRHAHEQKQSIDLSVKPDSHRVFLTKGQYHKLLKRLNESV